MRVLERGAGQLAAAWIELWGCGVGPVRGLSPQTRVLTGAMVWAACLLAPLSGGGVALLVVAAGGWIAARGVPWRVQRAMLVVSCAACLPLVVLAGVASAARAARWAELGPSLVTLGELLLRGVAAALVVTATAAALGMDDLRAALAALPTPAGVATISLQIVHQTTALLDETARIVTALAVRAAGRGGCRLLLALPRVWLPRLLARAERVAIAMQVRGVSEEDLVGTGRRSWGSTVLERRRCCWQRWA